MATVLPLTGELTFKSLVPPSLATCTRSEIKAYFENSYDLNESIFTGFTSLEPFYRCPDRLRLPLVFYYGHTAVVYVNKLILAGLLKERINPHYEALFETGVDEMSWDDTENYRMGGAFKWPSMEEVFEYRKKVREVILDLIETIPLKLPVTMEDPAWSLFMGFEHERIHLETSSVLIRQLPLHYLKRPEGWTYAPYESDAGKPGENSFVAIKGSTVTYGKPVDFPSFGWDNEYGSVTVDVPDFEVNKFIVSNEEFLSFVADGGYGRQELWTEEGWRWREFRQAQHPTFWVCGEGCKSGCGGLIAGTSHCEADSSAHAEKKQKFQRGDAGYYRYRAIFDVIPFPASWPADVNYHEAKAYCAWRGEGYRLPTEAEYMLMRDSPVPGKEGDAEGDLIYQPKMAANLSLTYGSSTPVNFFPPARSGVYDTRGNVWQWMEDHFNGLDGFATSYLYDDFSSPCFDGRHSMITGGSFISTGDEASRFARFSFRRHFFQHLGFRVVRSSSLTPVRLVALPQDKPCLQLIPGASADHVYTSTNTQYAMEHEDITKAALRTAFKDANTLSEDITRLTELARQITPPALLKAGALVIGSSVGGVAFDLSRHVDSVVGIDYWDQGIRVAQKLAKEGSCSLGEVGVSLPKAVRPQRCTFKQLTWTPNELSSFGLIVINDFLGRCTNPKAWLLRLRELCVQDGYVVVASSRCWGAAELLPFLQDNFELVNEAERSAVPLPTSFPFAPLTAQPLKVTMWRKL